VHLRYATRDVFEVRLRLKGSGTGLLPGVGQVINVVPASLG
jgi:hypothetical protein